MTQSVRFRTPARRSAKLQGDRIVTPELILASASPRRREILDRLGLAYRVHAASVEEETADSKPEELTIRNARLKTEAVAAIFPESVVLGADTCVFLEGRLFNKPATREEAAFMLGRLSGKTHHVVTGLCLAWKSRGRQWTGSVRSAVTFRSLTWETVRAYLEAVDPTDKAGGYGIQEQGEMLVASHRGSYTNIVGLPLEETAAALASFGIPVPRGNLRMDPDGK